MYLKFETIHDVMEGYGKDMIKSVKAVTLIGYEVEYFDLREARPRERQRAVKVYDAECIRAAEVLKGNIDQYITDNFAAKGYYVTEIRRQKAKRVMIDYGLLYEGSDTIEQIESTRH